MKFTLFMSAMAACVALSTGASAQRMFSQDTPGSYSFRVPSSGCYSFEVKGARGGDNNNLFRSYGGHGAVVTGNAYLVQSTYMTMIVGGKGESVGLFDDTPAGGGGGGGSFIIYGGQPLIVAGGGGGGAVGTNSGYSGYRYGSDGQGGQSGSIGLGYYGAPSGAGRFGGHGSTEGGAGGGGFGANGGNGKTVKLYNINTGTLTFPTEGGRYAIGGDPRGGGGINQGGYGGGGGGGFGGGGGGGYGGGGGGDAAYGGGGGGSYSNGAYFRQSTFKTGGNPSDNGSINMSLIGAKCS